MREEKREVFNRRHVESIGNRRRFGEREEAGRDGKGGLYSEAERSTGSSSKGDPVTDGIKRLAALH